MDVYNRDCRARERVHQLWRENKLIFCRGCYEVICDQYSILWHKHPKRLSHNLQVFAFKHYQYCWFLIQEVRPSSHEDDNTIDEGVDMLMVSIVPLMITAISQLMYSLKNLGRNISQILRIFNNFKNLTLSCITIVYYGYTIWKIFNTLMLKSINPQNYLP